MKIKYVVEQLVEEFGTPGEKRQVNKVVEVLTNVLGDRTVPDAVLDKVVKTGRKLKALGIK